MHYALPICPYCTWPPKGNMLLLPRSGQSLITRCWLFALRNQRSTSMRVDRHAKCYPAMMNETKSVRGMDMRIRCMVRGRHKTKMHASRRQVYTKYILSIFIVSTVPSEFIPAFPIGFPPLRFHPFHFFRIRDAKKLEFPFTFPCRAPDPLRLRNPFRARALHI